MIKEIALKNRIIEYDLQYKSVKNINLRIKSNGEIKISASRRVSQKVIEEFILSKADFILNALDKYKQREESPRVQYYTENELKSEIIELCDNVYPYYERLGVGYPQIKFRKMKSRWGSCHTVKKVLTFNLNLVYAPFECIEYIVYHEFTHFLQADHSPKFYEQLEKVCPNWKERRKRLRQIKITN